MPLLFATHVQQEFRGEEKRCQVLTTNLISHLKGHHRDEAVIRDFKQPPLLEVTTFQRHITHWRLQLLLLAFCNRLLRENSCFAVVVTK